MGLNEHIEHQNFINESIKEYLKDNLRLNMKRSKGTNYGRGGAPYNYDNLVIELLLDDEVISSDKINIEELTESKQCLITNKKESKQWLE